MYDLPAAEKWPVFFCPDKRLLEISNNICLFCQFETIIFLLNNVLIKNRFKIILAKGDSLYFLSNQSFIKNPKP